MENVKQFANNPNMVEDVRAEIVAYLERELLSTAYAGKDVSAIASAKSVIVHAFEFLRKEYAMKIEAPFVNENE